MKKYTDITPEEYEHLKRIHRQTEWTNDEMMAVVNLNKAYVNPRTPGCLTCSGSFRDTLNELRSFYLHYKEQIEENLKKKTSEVTVDYTDITKTNKKKKDGGTTKE